MKYKKPTGVPKPNLKKFRPIFGTEASFHGKLRKKPVIRQTLTDSHPEVIVEAITRLSRAGIAVPEYSYQEVDSFYSRLGSKKRSLRQNNLSAYLTRHLDAIRAGNKPPTSTINSLLDNAAKTIGLMQAKGVVHGHPHFGNFVVLKKRVGVIDFKEVTIKKIDWTNVNDIVSNVVKDFMHLNREWNAFQVSYNSNPKIVRALVRRRNRFYELIINQYPTTVKNKTKVLAYFLGISQDIDRARKMFP